MVLAVEEPKITDWMGAWFTLGSGLIALLALIAAAIAARATIQTNRNQSAQLKQLEVEQQRLEVERQRQEDDRLKQLASRFAVWVSLNTDPESGQTICVLTYHNSSQLPFYDVTVEWRIGKRTRGIHITNIAPTDEPAAIEDGGSFRESMQESADHVMKYQMTSDWREKGPSPILDRNDLLFYAAKYVEVRARFRDVNGVRWLRDSDGTLTRDTSAKGGNILDSRVVQFGALLVGAQGYEPPFFDAPSL
ncbi:hypothetical protein AB0F52_31010 [Amycolatopsis sp. NPDC024027]|uniref:hypothetical protein n=1 Tax=Amycolatopsis sp. NPDC024027 TaxID=3154327 RepID=UPI0033C98BA5